MTNLEWLLQNYKKYGISLSDHICRLCYFIKTKEQCPYCSDNKFCEFFKKERAFEYLLQEYKEPIKLKQWEYDLIKYHGNFAKFNDISILMSMKAKGHFKDMNSAKTRSMTIKDILDNCKIVSDDYEGFEDTK